MAAAHLSIQPSHGAAGLRVFVDLDERLVTGAPGTLLVRASGPEATDAYLAHVARRLRSGGRPVVVARAAAGATLFRDVAARLGIPSLDSSPARCAAQIAHAANARRVAVVAALPVAGTWDRAVADELAARLVGPLVVYVGDEGDDDGELHAERYDVSATLDAEERRRYWCAVAEEAQACVLGHDIVALEAWWAGAQRRLPDDARAIPSASAGSALRALALVARPWPALHLDALGVSAAAIADLHVLGAVDDDGGWLVPTAQWRGAADALASEAQDDERSRAAVALAATFAEDPWAHARAAALLLDAGRVDEADAAHAVAEARADEATARRELVLRWTRRVDALPRATQLPLRVRAAERALQLGEAEEAHAWAQGALAIVTPHAGDDSPSPEDVALERDVTLLYARSAVALGDLVAARVSLARARARSTSPADDAKVAVELAEIAYLGGDLPAAVAEAARAHDGGDARARLKARNVLGKVMLAEARWDDADRHFAEDAQEALAMGDLAGELRARLNRGIAILSKGLLEEARTIFEGVLADGERRRDARACAFALANLSVVAAWKHEYAAALSLAERTLKLSQHIGDRMKVAQTLATVAELRLKLGLFAHAEHAIAFGRRTLGPGIPPARSAHFCVVAARIALARGFTEEAQREIARAIAEAEADGGLEVLAQAYRVAARVALEDGDLGRAAELVARTREVAPTDEARAETAMLAALHARASGDGDLGLATEALALARAASEDELTREAHLLVAELHRAAGDPTEARAHVEQAALLRDRASAELPPEVRTAFLGRPDVAAIGRLRDLLVDAPAPSNDAGDPRAVRGRPPQGGLARSNAMRELVGDDPAIRGLHVAVKRIARANSTVLVRGESGTGKELVADAIHRASDRAEGPLVTVNCAALVETLLLSELFGHEKGAFTGAFARRRGRFELAEGGTLFLDEIGDISPRTQVALLRVLQERTFERVGGTAPIRANVRIICATNRDLRAMVERGEFREDLYYRLRGITLEIPPLRQRLGDLPRIAENLLARIAAERDESPKTMAPDALDLLQRHRWPGNVRELENALRAASLFADGAIITAANLAENVDDLRALAAPAPRSLRPSMLPAPPSSGPMSAAEPASMELPAVSERALHASEESDDAVDEDGAPLPTTEASATAAAYAQVRQGALSLADMKRTIERDCIARALAETKGNITRAATLLGMKRPRLSQLVKQYGLAVSSEGS